MPPRVLFFIALASLAAVAAVIQLLAVAYRLVHAGVIASKVGFDGALISVGTTLLAAFFTLTAVSLLCGGVACFQLRILAPRWAFVARLSTLALLICGLMWGALVLSPLIQLDAR
jgi:hypothetical protein